MGAIAVKIKWNIFETIFTPMQLESDPPCTLPLPRLKFFPHQFCEQQSLQSSWSHFVFPSFRMPKISKKLCRDEIKEQVKCEWDETMKEATPSHRGLSDLWRSALRVLVSPLALFLTFHPLTKFYLWPVYFSPSRSDVNSDISRTPFFVLFFFKDLSHRPGEKRTTFVSLDALLRYFRFFPISFFRQSSSSGSSQFPIFLGKDACHRTIFNSNRR